MTLRLPKFSSEAEEAEWWFTHRDEIADELDLSKPHPGPGRAARLLGEMQSKSTSTPATTGSKDELAKSA